jgi:hypothetical protein
VLVLNELYFWTLSIVWCLKKLRNKIYIPKNHNTHVQNSLRHQTMDKVQKYNSFNRPCSYICLLTEYRALKTWWGSGGIAPYILDLGTTWRWVVNFTPRPLYPQGNSPFYPLDRRLGGPQSRSEHDGEKKNCQPLPDSNPRLSTLGKYPLRFLYLYWGGGREMVLVCFKLFSGL